MRYVIKDGVWVVGGVDTWDPEEVVSAGEKKRSTSRHVVMHKMFTDGTQPAAILIDPANDDKLKATVAFSYSQLSCAWNASTVLRRTLKNLPTPQWGWEDLSVVTPPELTSSPACAEVYQMLVRAYHPDMPRGRECARQAFYLSGPPGVGKSYLLSVVLSSIVRTAIVKCPEVDSNFWPPVDVEARTMVLDEFGRGNVPLMKWKSLCDGHSPRNPLLMRILHGHQVIQHDLTIWVISNSPAFLAWNSGKIPETERQAAIDRFKWQCEIAEGDNLFPLIEYLENFSK